MKFRWLRRFSSGSNLTRQYFFRPSTARHKTAVDLQPLFAHRLPVVPARLGECVLGQARRKFGIVQHSENICRQGGGVPWVREQSRAPLIHDVTHSFRRRSHNRCAGGKRLQHRNRHVIQVGSIHENVRLIVKPAYLESRCYPQEIDSRQTQLLNQILYLVLQRTPAHKIELGLRPRLLDFSKGSHHYVNSVVRMESASTNEVWTHRTAQTKRKLRKVHNIWDNLRFQIELAHDTCQVPGRNYQPISAFQHAPREN